MAECATLDAPAPCPASAPPAPRWHGLLIALAGVALVAGCWNASFSIYDDSVHVSAHSDLGHGLLDTFTPRAGATYFPVTLLSYQFDRFLFGSWMPPLLGAWAPGVRLMSLLYHVLAALLLWRILLRLRCAPGQALFGALLFAAHPLACETVCWTSERKNALAGLFGFAAVWAWWRWEDRPGRVALTGIFYVLGLLSKPSVLGLLPVFALLDLFGGSRGLARKGPMDWRPGREWTALAERMLPLALLSAGALAANLAGHQQELMAPPGGSLYTACLTDLEILGRYLKHIAWPDNLSAVYLVEPIKTAADPRVWKYGLLLAAVAAATIYLAQTRRRAVLGWLWFLGALTPSLNFIALPHWMQDRYVYLSMPGIILVGLEAGAGILDFGFWILDWMFARVSASSRLRVIVAGSYLALLLCWSVVRSEVWASDLRLFQDAVHKQPRAAFARYGLGAAYGAASETLLAGARGHPESIMEAERCRRKWIENWRFAVDQCPDARRFGAAFNEMALLLADEARERGEAAEAEHYARLLKRTAEGDTGRGPLPPGKLP